jgi:GNAT superfamily N-acetyltransferase
VTSDVELRPYTEEDAPGCVEVFAAAVPWSLANAATWAHVQDATPPSAGMGLWVAAEDGRVVGFASAFLTWWTTTPGAASGGVFVHPDATRRGIGGALADLAERHLSELGASSVRTQAEERYLPFAAAREFSVASRKRVSAVDPRTVAGSRDPRVFSYRELADRRDELYRLDIATTRDIPNEGEFEMPFERWERLVWNDPLLALDGSFAALVDGRVAAATHLRVRGSRAGNWFTGTLREFRGLGLATAVKTAALLWAAKHGVERMHTFNDEENAAMLRVNDKLGYEPWLVALDLERG